MKKVWIALTALIFSLSGYSFADTSSNNMKMDKNTASEGAKKDHSQQHKKSHQKKKKKDTKNTPKDSQMSPDSTAPM